VLCGPNGAMGFGFHLGDYFMIPHQVPSTHVFLTLVYRLHFHVPIQDLVLTIVAENFGPEEPMSNRYRIS